MQFERLPKAVIPRNYELKLQPNLEPPFDFSGNVLIDIEVSNIIFWDFSNLILCSLFYLIGLFQHHEYISQLPETHCQGSQS